MSLIQTFNEWITLADAHELLGTASTGDDIEVSGMIADIDAMILSYLHRDLRHCEYSEITFRPEGSFFSVYHWPILTITSITSDGTAVPETDMDIDTDKGLLYFTDEGLTFTGTQPTKVVVQYTCGYDPLPLELQVMFRTLLVERNDASGSAAANSTGEIKKVSLVGVAAVEFDTGGSVAYSGVDRLSGVPEELRPYVGLLDRYRSDKTMGIV